ncbi:hypothetical protein [Streptomyces sp. NPDC001450]
MHIVAAMIRRFDFVAVQEARGNLRTLRHLVKVLGEDWVFTSVPVPDGFQQHTF